jgi:catechol 2,3-dioxygenase-like lactoylglutathione lyase family enzyme
MPEMTLAEGEVASVNTILYCRRWEEAVAFYRDGLGLRVLMANEWFVEFRLTETSRLSLADDSRASIKCAGGAGITIALEVDDLAAARGKALDAGLRPTEMSDHPWNARIFHVFDPEGRRIEVWQRGPAATGELV